MRSSKDIIKLFWCLCPSFNGPNVQQYDSEKKLKWTWHGMVMLIHLAAPGFGFEPSRGGLGG
jgi:hypothetical protein